jgi:hypothetical protein
VDPWSVGGGHTNQIEIFPIGKMHRAILCIALLAMRMDFGFGWSAGSGHLVGLRGLQPRVVHVGYGPLCRRMQSTGGAGIASSARDGRRMSRAGADLRMVLADTTAGSSDWKTGKIRVIPLLLSVQENLHSCLRPSRGGVSERIHQSSSSSSSSSEHAGSSTKRDEATAS